MENVNTPGLPEDEQQKFRQAYQHQKPPFDLEDRIVSELRNKGLLRITRFKKYNPAFALIILVLVFVSGFLWGNRQVTHPDNNQGQYLLLLRNPIGFRNDSRHVKEYGDWFRTLADKRAMGDRLLDIGWAVTKDNQQQPIIQAISPTAGKISGFFIIHAASEKAAQAIAMTCPHIKYNGTIELRPIQTHN
jgi:hypothetical protein